MYRGRALAAACMVLFAACHLRAAPVADALWADVEASVAAGDVDGALRMLAELTTLPGQKGPALERAAVIYLQQGKVKQAGRLLEQAAALTGRDQARAMLVRLYAREQRWLDMARLVEAYPETSWDDAAAALIRVAYRRLGRPPPVLRTTAGVLRRPRISGGFSAYASRDSPFRDDDSQDNEFSTEAYVRLRVPVAADWQLGGSLALGDERSEAAPVSFHEYHVRRLTLKTEARWRRRDGWRANLAIGPTWSQADRFSDMPDLDTPVFWNWSADLGRDTRAWRARATFSRRSFLDPLPDDLRIRRVHTLRLRGEYLGWKRWEVETGGAVRRFTGETEDYETADAELRFIATRDRHWALRAGVRHEFRDTDETILIGGCDWSPIIARDAYLMFGAEYRENRTTTENEVLLQCFWSRRVGQVRVSTGAAYRRELHVNDDDSLSVFLAFSPGRGG